MIISGYEINKGKLWRSLQQRQLRALNVSSFCLSFNEGKQKNKSSTKGGRRTRSHVLQKKKVIRSIIQLIRTTGYRKTDQSTIINTEKAIRQIHNTAWSFLHQSIFRQSNDMGDSTQTTEKMGSDTAKELRNTNNHYKVYTGNSCRNTPQK